MHLVDLWITIRSHSIYGISECQRSVIFEMVNNHAVEWALILFGINIIARPDLVFNGQACLVRVGMIALSLIRMTNLSGYLSGFRSLSRILLHLM